MGQTDLTTFCKLVNILDETIPTSTIDRKFIETKVVALSNMKTNFDCARP